MSVASKTNEGKIFVEALDCRTIREGNDWILSYIAEMKPKTVVADGANGQHILEKDMKDAKMKAPTLPTVKEIIGANATFEQGLFKGNICHSNQASLTQSVSNSEKRAIGSNGGFGYRSLKEGVEIALLDSVILAYWKCTETKERKNR